jgi:hypothetical protein
VLGQAASAEMELVNFALNHRSFGSAQITASTNPLVGGRFLPRLPRGDLHLHHTCFCVRARCDDESAQREQASSNLQQIGIGTLAQCSGQKAESNGHKDRAGYDDPVGCLLRHEFRSFARTRETAADDPR